MKIHRYKADAMFSEYIRSRDKVCQYCLKKAATQVHHHFSRRYWATRFDPENCAGFCFKCHRLLHENPAIQVEWWTKRIGKKSWDAMWIRSNQVTKRDWKMAELIVKAMMEEL